MVETQSQRQADLSTSLNYLIIGHLTADLTANGIRLGGTAAYSGLTANALGLKSGFITSHSPELDTSPLKDLWSFNKASQYSTTFKNISDGTVRTQYLYHKAAPLLKTDIPEFYTPPDIVHLGPMANEVDSEILDCFPTSLKCLTPQGWLRTTDAKNKVVYREWEHYEEILSQADVAIISHDDVQMREDIIASMASKAPVFVVTENYRGARIYWHNDARFITAPEVEYVDDTGAGDIFSAAFFYRYFLTKDPWEAGRFAVMLASCSVTRKNLDSIPQQDEIQSVKTLLVN